MTMEAVLGTQERIAEIIGDLDTIATLPEVTTRITRTVHDPKSTAGDLHRIIAHDPALVARVLKLVNSSFYARSAHIDSVERAIVLLGFDTVHHLAIAATLGQLFTNVKLCEGYNAKDLWTHSVAVGVVSRAMAQRFCRPMAEEVFLAGLVHDIGLLVLLQKCPDQLREVCAAAMEYPTPFCMLELGIIGVDHQELGRALAIKWGFPAACRVVAGYHHYPSMADDEWRTIAAIVHVADTLCCQERIGFHLSADTQIPDESAFKGYVPLKVIEYAKENLRSLASEAIRIFT